MAELTRVESAARINLRWIVRLRWGAVAGQVIAILLARHLVREPLPVPSLLAVCAALALANLGVHIWLERGGRPTDRACALNLLADIGDPSVLPELERGLATVRHPGTRSDLVHGAVAGREREPELVLVLHALLDQFAVARLEDVQWDALARHQHQVEREEAQVRQSDQSNSREQMNLEGWGRRENRPHLNSRERQLPVLRERRAPCS